MRLVVLFSLLFSLSAAAQDSIPATVENGKAYITYHAGNGETIFGISRMYSLEPKDLASFNQMDLKSGLKKEQVLKIPLTSNNLSQKECKDCGKVIYKVQAHEGLYRIGVNFANIGMTAIKKLNSLATDNVSIDQDLLVGYIKTGSGTVFNTPVIQKTEIKEKVEVKEPVIAKTETPKVTEKEKPVEPPKALVKIVDEVPVKEQKIKSPNAEIVVLPNPETVKSAFESQYVQKSGTSSNGTAAIFKTTSGWSDAKYYVLMSNVEPGTIVKVTARTTNKFVYAKVLGEMPVIKENEGLLLRISDAASGALGATDEHIDVTVNF